MPNTNINTIARDAKVSTTTVSNFINGTEVFPISADTKKRIFDVMRALNYRPHVGGTLMRRAATRPGRLGFVMGEDCRMRTLTTVGLPLIQRLLVELEMALETRFGWSLTILHVNDENSRLEWNEQLIGIDCLINFGQLNAQMCDVTVRRNLPLIELSSTEEFRKHGDFHGVIEEYDRVFWRNDRQIADLFERFYADGARKFLFLSSCNIASLRPDYFGLDAEAKLRGFESALAAHPDCEGKVLSPENVGDFGMFREFELVRRLLAGNVEELRQADAVIAHNDIVAYAAVSAAAELGRRPGGELRISGEGDFDFLRYWYPKIVTSSVDYAGLTEELCRLIEFRQKDRRSPCRRIEIPTHIVQR